MSSSISNIRSALFKAFMDATFFAQSEVEFPNIKFVPPTDKPWAKLSFVPIQPVVASLGAGGTDEQKGFLQIDLNYAQGSGEKEALAKFEAVRNLFTAGRRFAYSSQEVIVLSCGCAQGRIVDGFFRLSITVQFYAHVTRP